MKPNPRSRPALPTRAVVEQPVRRAVAHEQTSIEKAILVANPARQTTSPSYRRKRAIALILTILVVVAIPALVLALVMLG